MKTLRRFLPIVLLLLVSGCAYRANVVMLDKSATFAPTTQVEVLNSAPSRPYLRLAELDVEGFGNAPKVKLLETLVEAAKRLGADAFVETADEMKPEERVYCACGGEVTIPAKRIIEGIAIKYR